MNTAKEIFSSLQALDASEKIAGGKNDKMHKLFNLIVNERDFKDFSPRTAVDRVMLFLKYIIRDPKDINHALMYVEITKEQLALVNKYSSILKSPGALFIDLGLKTIAFEMSRPIELDTCEMLFRDLINANLPIMIGIKTIYTYVDEFFISAYMHFFYQFVSIDGYYINRDKFYPGREFDEDRSFSLDYNVHTFAEFKMRNTIIPYLRYSKTISTYKKGFIETKNKKGYSLDLDLDVFEESELRHYWNNEHPEELGDFITPDGYNFIANEPFDKIDEASLNDSLYNHHKFAIDLGKEISIDGKFDIEILKGYKVVLFNPLHIINISGFNRDSRGSDVSEHPLSFKELSIFEKEFSLYELGNALYNMKSHKFENWYEMWCDRPKFTYYKTKNTTIALIVFDHGS
jgi:hypothetical protein